MTLDVHLYTERLILHRPRAEDAEEIFRGYASDPDVTRYVCFPTHKTHDDAKAFLTKSDAAWNEWPAGPFLIRIKTTNQLIGGTGLSFETSGRAMTGYILARDAWGKGYATESLHAMVKLASRLNVKQLYALCHTDHRASWHVLEKCGFLREGILRSYERFPNLGSVGLSDVYCYAIIL
ncbi:MAG TPA: GNAT family N-acetyltransferase [Bacteroidota bacterium]|nr:GNAT family N-acetyltransferase [Bacteroidota bacterium]